MGTGTGTGLTCSLLAERFERLRARMIEPAPDTIDFPREALTVAQSAVEAV